jgi:hypothetical protein
MATLKSYIDQVAYKFNNRYDTAFWVGAANLLLERLSGAGILPPQNLARGAVVRNGVWVDRPPMCRDVNEIRLAGDQSVALSFVEENGRIRLTNRTFPEAVRETIPIIGFSPSGLTVARGGMDAGHLDGWLFAATGGEADGQTFIVAASSAPAVPGNILLVTFLETPGWSSVPAGYFVSPKDYLILSYTARIKPLVSVDRKSVV